MLRELIFNKYTQTTMAFANSAFLYDSAQLLKRYAFL